MKEIKSLRKRNERHFLNSDGSITCYLYNHDIHYKKNNEYVPINNKLINNKNYIQNEENDFKVSFLKDKRKKEILDINKDNHYLKISLDKRIAKNPEIKDNKISYKEALDNIDIDYEVISKTLKESIIIKDKNSIPKNLSFRVDTDLRLRINNGIEAKDENKNIIFMIEKPFMKDSKENYNYNINYTLIKGKEDYLLKLNLDQDWLESKDRVYPVIIDPTITCNENSEVLDTYITSEYPAYTWEEMDDLQLFVKENGEKSRILLKFKLPNIGTGCDIIKAGVYLATDIPNIINNPTNNALVNVHALSKDWTPDTATWNNMSNNYNSRIEDFTYTMKRDISGNSEDLGITELDITRLVRGWYSGEDNYGIMVKRADENYNSNIKTDFFFSKTFDDLHNTKVGPTLIINYRNLNGLEDYMSYKTGEFSEGASYINNLTGNLTTTFNLNETIGGKYPIGVSLIYNTNDVVLNNNIGYGLGWKFNLHETIKETEIDSNKYLEYVDADGTLHYFRYDYDNESNLDTSKYIDEDGLGLTAILKGNTYVVTDKNSNEYIFTKNNNTYYLTKLIDTSKNEVVIEYTNNKITKVTDANNSSINISYNANSTVITSDSKTSTINYSNNKVTSIVTKLGTTSFSYDSNNIITKITDTSGISYKYEYYDKPYKIKKVTELGLDNSEGNYYNYEYGYLTSKVRDSKNHYNMYTFNERGNVLAVTNLDKEESLNKAYAKGFNYENEWPKPVIGLENFKFNKAANKMYSTTKPFKNIDHYLKKVEVTEFIKSRASNYEITTECSNSGNQSLKITEYGIFDIPVEGNKYYTFSAYFKNEKPLSLSVFGTNKSIVIPKNDEFTRYSITDFIGENETNFSYGVLVQDWGVAYIDDIQIEEGEVANFYNYVDNGDFKNGLNGWNANANNILTGEEVTNRVDVVNINDNEKALRIKSHPDLDIMVSKTIPIKGTGKKTEDNIGDIYNLSFWYKNTGLKKAGRMGQDNSNCVLVSYDYTNIPDDMGYGLTPIGLTPNADEWQFFSSAFVADSRYDYDKLNIIFFSEENANELYISNISLTKDINDGYSDYDPETGNLKSSQKDNDKTSFKYDKNNQLTSMFNPMRNNFKFEYDNTVTDRVLKGISPTGISNEIKYDNNGNPIKTIINNVNPLGDISTNSYGILKLKYENKYLNNNLTFNENINNIVIILEESGEYRFKLEDQYLACVDDKIVLSPEKNDNTLFTFSSEGMENEYISPKNAIGYLTVNDNNMLEILPRDRKNLNQSFSIDYIDIPYSIRIKGTNKYLDCDFINKTLSFKEDNCSNDRFTLIKENDYYRFKIGDLYLAYSNNKFILSKTKNDDTLFKLRINDNGSYVISPKVKYNVDLTENDFTKKVNYNIEVDDNNNLTLKLEDKENCNQQFYFEDINTPLFIETKAEYTSDGKFITKTIDALEKTTEYDINPVNGLTNSVTDANKVITNYTYNNKDQITKVTKNNKEVKYEYNNSNLLNKITSGNKNYNFSYDNFLNTKDIKINNNTLVTNEYEVNNGNLLKSTYGNNSSISYTYDELDRIKTLTNYNKTYNYTYDNLNNLAKIKTDNEEHTYLYDLSKRLARYILRNNKEYEINYTYDKNGNYSNITYSLDNNKENISFQYNEDDAVTKVIFDNNNLNYTYDYLGRLIIKDINNKQKVEYEYKRLGNKTSTVLKSMKINNDLYEYTYDNLYNITDIYLNNELINHYEYDNFNELIKEDDYRLNKTIKYTYDTEGNILKKEEYELNTENIINTNTYEYNNTSWEDQLTKFNNDEITYDNIGNPLTIGSKILSWINGRQLSKYTDTDLEIEYTYNKDGIRTKKIVNNKETDYFTEGNKIIFETSTDNMIYYIRDEEGSLIGLKYNDTMYYYIKNMQEDIIGITDSNNNLLCSYLYDSWGNIISIKDNNGNIIRDTSHIGIINPYRYRSYYYDNETKLYYLNSRYYNPEWGRFINADVYLGCTGDILGYNLYLYVSNNPVNNSDETGRLFKKAWSKIKEKAKQATKTVKNVVNKVVSVAKKTVSKAKKAVENVKKSFVFEAEIGLGAGVNVGVGLVEAGAEATKTFGYSYSNNESKQYTSTAGGIDVGIANHKVGLSMDIRNYDDGDRNPFTMPWEIWNDKNTVKDFTVIYSNKSLDSESSANGGMFIGINLGAFLIVGGKIKIGFNVGG